eukprot:TRINITY_DN4064_c0_g1_i1.p1 TRINITY_DN4064_c0_g1~~TRINITY_DN4064_c0_g1_i1.p1  ORF type:complete len:157 (+),score=73.54 TRINITY_DN4064_c0_g1_i1:33-473(+)
MKLATTSGYTLPQKAPVGFFKSLFAGESLEDMFNQMVVDTASQNRSQGDISWKQLREVDDEKKRRELLGEKMQQMQQKKATGQVNVDPTSLNNIMAKNREALDLRGEKLSKTAQQAEEMAENSSQFAANARKLREKMEKKSMFDFF